MKQPHEWTPAEALQQGLLDHAWNRWSDTRMKARSAWRTWADADAELRGLVEQLQRLDIEISPIVLDALTTTLPAEPPP